MSDLTYKTFCKNYYVRCLIRCIKEHNLFNPIIVDERLKHIFREIKNGETNMPHVLVGSYFEGYFDFDYEKIEKMYIPMIMEYYLNDLIEYAKSKYNIVLEINLLKSKIKEKYLYGHLTKTLHVSFENLFKISMILYNN